jgi:hypothetical protein
MVEALTIQLRKCSVEAVIPKLLSRPARHRHDNAPRRAGFLGGLVASGPCVGRGDEPFGIIENDELRDQVGDTVAIEVGRGLDQLAGPRFIAEMGQPAQRGDRVALGTSRPRGLRSVPDGLSLRSIATDQGLSVPLDEVGLARSQHDGFGDECERDGLAPQQAVVVER